MRNTESYRRSPKPVRTVGVGQSDPVPDPRDQTVGASPSRHFTPTATNMVTPKHVFVELDPHGERREVIDGRD